MYQFINRSIKPMTVNKTRLFFISGILFLLFAMHQAGAQQVTIKGYAPGAEKRTIKLSTPGDLITNLEVTLAETQIDTTGHFSFVINPGQTIYALFSINFHKAEIFLQPGHSYDLKFTQLNYDEYTEVNPFIQSQNLVYEQVNPAPGDLNEIVGAFNTLYSSFLMDHFKELYNDRNRALLAAFKDTLSGKFGTVEDPYFQTYVTYKIASLDQLTQSLSQPQMIRKYFTGQPVHYRNLEYMDFFNSFFTRYITVTSNILRKVDFHSLLKEADSYKAAMKSMATDTLLKDEQLRELVMLKGMLELYDTPTYNQDQILKVLRTTVERSKFPENKQVAENMVKTLTRFKPGTPAPGFTLLNRELKKQSLSSFQGKPVVLNFWTTYCEGCLSEMDLIKPLWDKYNDKVHFVSISADRYYGKMLFFINLKKDYVWNFLSTEDKADVLIDYDVRTYPLFVLIDKNGNIARYPAGHPSGTLEAEIQKLIVE